MRKHLPLMMVALVLSVSLPLAAEDKPAPVDVEALQVRATQALSAKEYTTALPLLKKVAEKLKDQPERLGQVEEQIRVCEKNIAKQAKATLDAKTKPTKTKTTTSSPTSPVPLPQIPGANI